MKEGHDSGTDPGRGAMPEGDLVVAVVPARGGSKSIPRKNLAPLLDRPLISWSIDAARRSPSVDRVIVSTDDVEIGEVSRSHDAEVYPRPPYLATDESLVIDALRDLIATLESEGRPAEIMVVLEPTCPLRSVEDIERCVALLRDGYDSAATFTTAAVNPHRTWRLSETGPEPFIDGAVPWLPRQKLPQAYQLNGAVYAFRTAGLMEGTVGLLFGRAGAVIMPAERSIDIDSYHDLRLAENTLTAVSNDDA